MRFAEGLILNILHNDGSCSSVALKRAMKMLSVVIYPSMLTKSNRKYSVNGDLCRTVQETGVEWDVALMTLTNHMKEIEKLKKAL